MRLADMPTALRRTEESFSRYVERPVPGITAEQVQSSGYWQHIHDRLRVGDVVEIRPQDSTFYMELWLIQKQPGKLVWRVTHMTTFETAAAVTPEPAADGLVVEWGGKTLKYRIVDRSPANPNGLEVAAGFATEELAQQALADFRRV